MKTMSKSGKTYSMINGSGQTASEKKGVRMIRMTRMIRIMIRAAGRTERIEVTEVRDHQTDLQDLQDKGGNQEGQEEGNMAEEDQTLQAARRIGTTRGKERRNHGKGIDSPSLSLILTGKTI